MKKLRIFISYARRDRCELAAKLYQQLAKVGHVPWMDVEGITGGHDWVRRIEDEIEGCDVLLAVVSPGALASKICDLEQFHAWRLDKGLIPLKTGKEDKLPFYLGKLHYLDFSESSKFDEIFAQLAEALRKKTWGMLPERYKITKSNAPKLPTNFMAREDELQTLRQALLGDETSGPVSLSALHGMGGIGKSVLAKALCHDSIVQAAFPDGVCWIPIGPQPSDLAGKLATLGEFLGDTSEHYITQEKGQDRLRVLLCERAVLVVLDDIWKREHVEPFLVEAPRCRLLFTTRQAKMAVSLGAFQVPLGTLSPVQAEEFLRRRAGRDDPGYAEIAFRLGYLPLALNIAGVRLKMRDVTAAEWLDDSRKVSRIKENPDAATREDNLAVCFTLTVDLLKENQRLFHVIGLFAEGTTIPAAALERLWKSLRPDWTAYDCREMTATLVGLSLVDGNWHDGIRVHGLLRAYALECLGGPEAGQHIMLLNAYQPSSGLWGDLQDDGYIYHHLAWHLQCAYPEDGLARLLAESTTEGRNAWFETRRHAGQTAGYLGDLQRAQTATESSNQAGVQGRKTPPLLHLEVRWGLIRGTVLNLSEDAPPALLAAMVREGVLTFGAALGQARQLPKVEDLVPALFSLLPHASPPDACALLLEINKAVAASSIYGIRERVLRELVARGQIEQVRPLLLREEDWPRLDLLGELMPWIDDPAIVQAIYERAMREARTKPLYGSASYYLALLLEKPLPNHAELADAALVSLRALEAHIDRFDQALWVLPHCPDRLRGDVVEIALEGLHGWGGTDDRLARALNLAPFLEPAQLLAALEEIRLRSSDYVENTSAFSLEELRVGETLAKLAANLEEIPVYHQSNFFVAYARAFVKISHALPNLQDHFCRGSVELLRKIKESYRLRPALEELLPETPERLLPTLLELAHQLDVSERAQLLLKAIKMRPNAGVAQAVIEQAEQVERLDQRIACRLAAAPLLTGREQAEILEESERMLAGVEDEDERFRLELRLRVLQRADESAYPALLQRVDSGQLKRRFEALSLLAQEAPAPLVPQILERALREDHSFSRGKLLVALAPRLSREQLGRVHALSGRVGDRGAALGAIDALELVESRFDYWEEADRESPEAKDVRGNAPNPPLLCLLFEEAASQCTGWLAAEAVTLLANRLRKENQCLPVFDVRLLARLEGLKLRPLQLAKAVKRLSPLVPLAWVRQKLRALENAFEFATEPDSAATLATEPGWTASLLELLPAAERAEAADQLVTAAEKMDEMGSPALLRRSLGYPWLKPAIFAGAASSLLPPKRHAVEEQAFALTMERPDSSFAAIMQALASSRSQAQLLEVWKVADRFSDSDPTEPSRTASLLAVAPFLAAEHLTTALEAAQWLDKPERAFLLSEHIRRFPNPETRVRIAEEALAATRSLHTLYHRYRVKAFVMIATEVDGEAKRTALQEALESAIEAAGSERRSLTAAVVPHLCFLPFKDAYACWREVWAAISPQRRAESLEAITSLRLLLLYLGGLPAVRGTAEAIRQVCAWWP